MRSLKVENVVATGDLDTRIIYADILDQIELPHLQYDPDIHQGLELRFIEGGPLVTVYATGKYIIRASTFDKLSQTRKSFLELLSENGIIADPIDVTFDINNVVMAGDLAREVDLTALAVDLKIDEVKYDPQHFPALRCKLRNHKPTILLYRSGKVIITGAESVDDAEDAFEEFQKELETLFSQDK